MLQAPVSRVHMAGELTGSGLVMGHFLGASSVLRPLFASRAPECPIAIDILGPCPMNAVEYEFVCEQVPAVAADLDQGVIGFTLDHRLEHVAFV